MKYVVKIGTKTITNEAGAIDEIFLASLALQIAKLWQLGVRVLLVCSGAVALGFQQLGWGIYKTSETNILDLQQAAAAGQPLLMAHLNAAFAAHGIKVGQFLYTREQLQTATLHNIIKTVLVRSLDKQSMMIPVINENDVITDEELKKIGAQGDNDILASQVAILIKADKVVFLTNVDGIKTANKAFAKNIHDENIITCLHTRDQLHALKRELEDGSRVQKTQISNGGMVSKFNEAYRLYGGGIPSWIVNGRVENILLRIHQNEVIGTRIDPKCSPASQKPSRQ